MAGSRMRKPWEFSWDDAQAATSARRAVRRLRKPWEFSWDEPAGPDAEAAASSLPETERAAAPAAAAATLRPDDRAEPVRPERGEGTAPPGDDALREAPSALSRTAVEGDAEPPPAAAASRIGETGGKPAKPSEASLRSAKSVLRAAPLRAAFETSRRDILARRRFGEPGSDASRSAAAPRSESRPERSLSAGENDPLVVDAKRIAALLSAHPDPKAVADDLRVLLRRLKAHLADLETRIAPPPRARRAWARSDHPAAWRNGTKLEGASGWALRSESASAEDAGAARHAEAAALVFRFRNGPG